MDEEGSKLGVVARSLAADADFDVVGVGFLDEDADHLSDSGISFIEERGKVGRISVDAEDELGEIIGADGKSIEAGGELISEDDVRGDLCHHVDL